MRKLVITLDDELDTWLSSHPNQNDTVRKALNLYKGDITTDTVSDIKKSYLILKEYIQQHFEQYDESFSKLDILISELEMRMQ